jgi:hypothetical protein
MQVHAVIDTKGAGRLVGIFQTRERAERVRDVDRAYFRLVTLELDALNPVAAEWLPSDKRELLRRA